MSLKSKIKDRIQNYKEKKGYSFNNFTIEEMLDPEFFAYNYYQYGNWYDKLEFPYQAAIFQELLAISGIGMRYGIERSTVNDMNEIEYVQSLSLYLQKKQMCSISESQLEYQPVESDIDRMLNFKLTREEIEQKLLLPNIPENNSYNERIIAFAKRYKNVQTEILGNNYKKRFQAEIDRLDKSEGIIYYKQTKYGNWKEVDPRKEKTKRRK